MEIGPWAQGVPNGQIVIRYVLRKYTFQGRSRGHGNRALRPGPPEWSDCNKMCTKEMYFPGEGPKSWK